MFEQVADLGYFVFERDVKDEFDQVNERPSTGVNCYVWKQLNILALIIDFIVSWLLHNGVIF